MTGFPARPQGGLFHWLAHAILNDLTAIKECGARHGTAVSAPRFHTEALDVEAVMLGLVSATCAVGVATIAALTTVDLAQIDLSWLMAGLTAAASAIAFGFTSLEV